MSDKPEVKAETKAAGTEPSKIEADLKKDDKVDNDGEHKLQTPWTFYVDKKLPKTADYNEFLNGLSKVGSFTTIEGFWRHYGYVLPADEVPKDHNVFLFRSNLIPAWETFPNGGCWIVKVRKRNGVINRLWEELVAAVVSEQFEQPDIVGVVLSTRLKEDLLSIWNKENNPEVRFAIGDKLREILNLDESTQVEYKPFKSAMRDGSSYRNAKAYVYAAQLPYAAAVAGQLPAQAQAPAASQ